MVVGRGRGRLVGERQVHVASLTHARRRRRQEGRGARRELAVVVGRGRGRRVGVRRVHEVVLVVVGQPGLPEPDAVRSAQTTRHVS